MQYGWTAAEYLNRLNEYVKVQAPDIVEKLDLTEKQIGDLFPRQMLRFAKTKIDIVICGPCSAYVEQGESESFNRNTPMGRVMVKAGEPAQSWLDAVIKDFEQKNG